VNEEDAEGYDPDDPGDADDRDVGEEEDDEGSEPEVTIDISGLSLYTHMGVTEAEREVGQRLLIDIRIDVGEADATITDRVEDTVNYAEVCELVALVAHARSYRTLERFCAAVIERMLERYEVNAVWVKAAKPEPPIALPVSEVSVEVWREG
jgi:dihydroneopterin aldolase